MKTPRDTAEGSDVAREELRIWLKGLPKPIAIMVSSDQRGLGLLEACREENIPVPERIAVASVDNDVPLCEISSPPLSSTRAGHARVGFEAARLLQAMMNGAPPPAAPIYVPPNSIISRKSSDIQSIEDAAVAQGLHYIHENLSNSLSNESVARVAGLSRTLFQRRFLESMGTTIRDYIVQQRVRRARNLIENSDLTFAEIAQQSGFRHQEYMGQVIKNQLGMTPGKLREQQLSAKRRS